MKVNGFRLLCFVLFGSTHNRTLMLMRVSIWFSFYFSFSIEEQYAAHSIELNCIWKMEAVLEHNRNKQTLKRRAIEALDATITNCIHFASLPIFETSWWTTLLFRMLRGFELILRAHMLPLCYLWLPDSSYSNSEELTSNTELCTSSSKSLNVLFFFAFCEAMWTLFLCFAQYSIRFGSKKLKVFYTFVYNKNSFGPFDFWKFID